MKTTFNHIHIWGCPTQVLRNRVSWTNVQECACLLVIQEGQKGSYFYNSKKGKVFVFTSATFLEESYIKDFKLSMQGYA